MTINGEGAAPNMTVDLLIVGGGPAGLGVARGYREAGGTGTVLLVGADEHPPYARPPLTKEYLRGEADADSLPLVEPEWYADNAVELRLGTPATSLDVDRRQVVTSDGTVISYSRLALATGSSPSPLPLPGGDLPGLIYVRDRHSGEALRGIAQLGRNVVVIGSGFIGCEAAASLARRGASVVLVTDEELPHAARLGTEAGARIRDWLVDAGVVLVLGDGVASLTHTDDEGWRVDLVSGRILSAEAVVSGSGARPNVGLAAAAGLRVENGGVVTDHGLRTSNSSVWAVGDIAYAHNPAAGRPLRVEHWGEAETMGEIAGANIAGQDRHWSTAPGFWSGIGEHELKYSAWGDGHEEARLIEGPDGGWAVWYVQDDTVVGVLTYDWDEAYETGQALIERAADAAEALAVPNAPR